MFEKIDKRFLFQIIYNSTMDYVYTLLTVWEVTYMIAKFEQDVNNTKRVWIS